LALPDFLGRLTTLVASAAVFGLVSLALEEISGFATAMPYAWLMLASGIFAAGFEPAAGRCVSLVAEPIDRLTLGSLQSYT